MADVFEDRDDLTSQRDRLWKLIADTPHLDWLLLTKRPQNVGRMVPWGGRWPRNVWLGTTVENQRWAEKRIPHLLEQPAAVSFLSCEPLLGSINLDPWLTPVQGSRSVGWVIVGGESGPRARPMNPDWARALRDQCDAHGVPFHFKQWGNWRPASGRLDGHEVRNVPSVRGNPIRMVKIGKKAAGRKLDGQERNGLPTAA
jgi:protein gp37